MILSVALILLAGLAAGWLCGKIRFPKLFGMILAGILLGPHGLNLIDASVLNVSAELRKIALIVILIRAGLKLSSEDLRRAGRPAVLMCFLPAVCEILGMVLLGPAILGISPLEAAILGSVIAAVSPAVVVPRMIRLIDEGYGTEKSIPQMILAGASVDDVVVIVLFSTFTGLAKGQSVNAAALAAVPVSVVTGIGFGLLLGWGLAIFFERADLRGTMKVMLMLAASFLMVTAEDRLPGLPFASLIAVMAMGLMIRQKTPGRAARLSARFDRLWVPSEIFLFVLVGASVAVESALQAGPRAILLILLALLFRMAGVWLCLLHTGLSRRERLFCMMAYTPKATVQAAIGGLPLAMGLPCGNLVLTVSVIAILLTAPLGAFAIDGSYRRLLTQAK